MAPLLLVLVTGCIPTHLPVPGGGPGFILVIDNASPSDFVAEVTEPFRSSYYAVPSGASVTVDTVGEMNPGAEGVRLFDPDCSLAYEVEGTFWDGGLIVVTADRTVSFVPRLMGPGDDRQGARESCIEAAAELARD